MTKEQIFELINGMQHPVMYVATTENDQPHVRGILLFRADENGIIFHTGDFKALYHQLKTNPKTEVCFSCGKYQVRVEGEFILNNDIELKREILNHPSRAFLRKWAEEQGEQAVFDFLQVFCMKHGKAHVWCMEDNFKPKEYIEL